MKNSLRIKTTTLFHYTFMLLASFLISNTALANGGGNDGEPGMPCSEALPFCSDEEYDFINVSDGTVAPPGANYGCLLSQPNPVWYFMEIENDGVVVIDLEQTTQPNGLGIGLDVDFAMWGPFTNVQSGCDAIMAGNLSPLQCSYSPAPTETLALGASGGYSGGASTPPAAQQGEIYIVLITNYDGDSGYIQFNQTNFGNTGAGSTNCDIVVPCNLTGGTAEASACDPATNSYSITGQVEFTDAPEGGTLVISDCNGNTQTFTEPFSSPTSFTFTGLNADGQNCDISAFFLDADGDEMCVRNISVEAPENCVCDASDLAVASTIPSNPSCTNACDGQIQANVTGGEGNITFVWKDADGNTVGGSGPIATDLCSGTYTYTATDENGCIVSGQATLLNPSEENASFTLTDFCAGDSNSASSVATPGGTFAFNPEPGDGATINPSTGSISNGVAGTTYTVEYTTANCGITSTETVTVNESPVIDFTANPEVGQPVLEVTFTNNTTGNNDYHWNFGDGFTEDNNDDQVLHNFEETGVYVVTLTAVSSEGCVASDTVTINVFNPDMSYAFPNVFSPNNDGQNDTFHLIDPMNIGEIEVVILNRWGNVVFESTSVDFEWNGKVKNTGGECGDGTYFYKANIKNLDGEEKVEHGHLQLVR